MMRIARAVLAVALPLSLLVAGSAQAWRTPNGAIYRELHFPVVEPVHYFDDFGGVRHHPGNDLMGAKLDHLVAANDGTVTFLRTDSSGHSGNMLILTGTDGWKYWYIHVNNDTPGTDDGKNPARWRFAPGLHEGSVVSRGQFLGYMGDSGEAETTAPHLHFELHLPDDTVIDPYTSLRLAQGLDANGQCAYRTDRVRTRSATAGHGYWTIDVGGAPRAFGAAKLYGTPPVDGAPYVALAPTRTGKGYWTVTRAGIVAHFGDAYGYGGMQGKHYRGAIVAIAPTQSGKGFWLLGANGAVYRFGDAARWGATASLALATSAVAITPTITGLGYWIAHADGSVHPFGDAADLGSVDDVMPKPTLTGMAADTTGHGYWLLAKDGRVFAKGDAPVYGSPAGHGWCSSSAALGIARAPMGHGYWILMDDGRVAPFGRALPWGEPKRTGALGVAIAVLPSV
ncbi:MAG TPA: M23 family metallopeptidase [Acidimicrobiia bacterium]|nr:M23 family metallopeptidase [Acidimicrobiia bacterium]